MTMPKPIFDAAGLALFLQAHVMVAGDDATGRPRVARDDDPDRLKAEEGERTRLRGLADVSAKVFDRAFRGKPIHPAHRRRLWLAMDVNPDIGGQGQ